MRRRRFTLPALLLALILGLVVGVTGASAATPNDTGCRKGLDLTSVSNAELLAYTACRDDKIDVALAGLQPTPSPTPTSSASPSTSPTATPTVTPTATASPTSSPTASAACTNPSITFTGEGSQGVGNGYDISAEQWGVKAGYQSTLRFCSKDSWNVTITAKDDDGQHAVQSYPSIRKIYHDWSTSDFSRDPRLSSFPRLAVDFAVDSPDTCSGCIYETAFDNWLNGIGNGASTEQMIWLHNVGQRPYGNKVASGLQISGHTWDLWTGNSNHYVAFVPTDTDDIAAGTVDVKAFTQYQVDHGYIGATSLTGGTPDPYVGQISLGVEPVKVNGQRWDFDGFTVLDR